MTQIPAGFRLSGLHCGIKKNGALDLGLIVCDSGTICAGVYTTNLVVAAPVVLSRTRLQASAEVGAVIVNSGNANACTGDQGMSDAEDMTAAVGALLDVDPAAVQVCSTGVIGAPLPMAVITEGLPQVVEAATAEGLPAFAEAIMTTDTRPKHRTVSGEIAGRTITVAGTCKGAGMIHPNMATMLAFLLTDAPIAAADLQSIWARVCTRTFNAITVDGDTSTNDTALLLASGAAGGEALTGADLEAFEALVEPIARELALDIIRDSEGGTKTVAITVSGAASTAEARQAAQTIALSPLVKTAIHGEDPNWGRIVAAAGRAGVQIAPDRVSVRIDDVVIYAEGVWQGPESEARAHTIMKTPEYPIQIDLGVGEASSTVFTCDFSKGYIDINASYRS
ncbi:MAG: bifunctional glutamate N-acetyltransferase/amino-acid acetyltransferase ArgJ [Bradymonadia bacterium]